MAASDDAAKRKIVRRSAQFRGPATVKNVLDLLPELVRYQRLMVPVVQLIAPLENTGVEPISQYLVNAVERNVPVVLS